MSTVFVISITTFTADGALDEAALRAHLRRMADGGVGVYVAGSGSGEGYSLSAAERDRVFEITADELSGRTPARAMGVEPRSAAEMLALAAAAKAAGLDAVQVYSLDLGHGHLPSPGEVERYLRTVLDGADVPLVVSTHQSAGYRIDPVLLAALVADYPHLVGVNCTHADLAYLTAVIDAASGRDVHVGGPAQALTALALGATGYLTSEANLSPALCRQVVDAFDDGDLRRAADSYARVVRLSNLLYARGGIRATKAVLNALGLPGGSPRLPQLPVPPADASALVAQIRALGALDAA
ncbi:MAG TPA: dihydrodipicolinate synthase family protein [Acidimicrobiales bacterium]|nr:dihydrodipicolinate synthase family protein [Acidimicrobiales bacterium]